MSKVIVVQVIYNSKKWIEPVFNAIFNQTFKDFKVVAVISGNEDRGKELLINKFPQVEIIDPNYNIGFAKGHNMVFQNYLAEFYQLVNPDMVMIPNYIEEMLKGFENKTVGSATGKLYKLNYNDLNNVNKKEFLNSSKILDTTGVVIKKSGRVYDRGQYEVDMGQYDTSIFVDAVSGAGAMYRRQALTSLTKELSHTPAYGRVETEEFFDEDFHSYFEDVDLGWRMKNKGWKNIFVPKAIGFHGRTAGSSKGGYKKFTSFVKHHSNLPLSIRQLNYKNHILMYIKNSPYFYPQFFIREFFMFLYILFFEIKTLKILPKLFSQFKKIWKKRKLNYQ